MISEGKNAGSKNLKKKLNNIGNNIQDPNFSK